MRLDSRTKTKGSAMSTTFGPGNPAPNSASVDRPEPAKGTATNTGDSNVSE